MAQNTTVNLTSAWSELTDANITSITFLNVGHEAIEIMATTGSTPANADGALLYRPNIGERNAALSDLFPGVSGANRVFARAAGPSGRVAFGHG